MHKVNELLGGQVEQVVEVDATVGELAEGTLLLQLKRGDLLIIRHLPDAGRRHKSAESGRSGSAAIGSGGEARAQGEALSQCCASGHEAELGNQHDAASYIARYSATDMPLHDRSWAGDTYTTVRA